MIIIKHLRNIIFLLKISEVTDFSLFTSAVRDVCYAALEKIEDKTTFQELTQIAEFTRSGIVDAVKEKRAVVSCAILRTKSPESIFSVYKHKFIHGKEYQATCERTCIFVSDKEIARDDLVDLSIEVMGFKYHNLFIEENFVTCESNFSVNRTDGDVIESAKSIPEILKIVNGKCNLQMVYSI